MTKNDRVRHALWDLGTTETEVAEKLYKLGCKGEREDGNRCPVATYLNKVTGLSVNVDRRVCYIAEEYVNELRDDSVATPIAVGQFVRAFDDSRYPGLEL